jgi:hypothetical protein
MFEYPYARLLVPFLACLPGKKERESERVPRIREYNITEIGAQLILVLLENFNNSLKQL